MINKYRNTAKESIEFFVTLFLLSMVFPGIVFVWLLLITFASWVANLT